MFAGNENYVRGIRIEFKFSSKSRLPMT